MLKERGVEGNVETDFSNYMKTKQTTNEVVQKQEPPFARKVTINVNLDAPEMVQYLEERTELAQSTVSQNEKFQSLLQAPEDDEFDSLFQSMNPDKDGNVDFEKFVNAAKEQARRRTMTFGAQQIDETN